MKYDLSQVTVIELQRMAGAIDPENARVYIEQEARIKKLGFGNITVTYRIHRGKITDAVYQSHERVRYAIQEKT